MNKQQLFSTVHALMISAKDCAEKARKADSEANKAHWKGAAWAFWLSAKNVGSHGGWDPAAVEKVCGKAPPHAEP